MPEAEAEPETTVRWAHLDGGPGAAAGEARLRRRCRWRWRWRWRLLPTPQGLVVLAAAIAGARLGLRPIGDNSTLVHLRTGLELLRTGHVPHRDPYSYTAPGHPWVVQSWLASLAYGLADRAGHHVLVLEQGVVMALVGAVIAVAARSSTALRSGVAAALAVGASAPGWSPRPLMFGLLGLGLTVVIVERRAHPAWLVPVVWLWVNTHGSFPLGLAWLGARAVGEAIDVRGWPRVTLPRLGVFVVGLGLAIVNPVGARLLTFPIVALHKRSTFQAIVEWRSPNFQDPNDLIALVFIALSLLVLFRAPLPWAQLLPVCGFVVLALIAARNLGPLGVVLAPALAAALAIAPAAMETTSAGGTAPPGDVALDNAPAAGTAAPGDVALDNAPAGDAAPATAWAAPATAPAGGSAPGPPLARQGGVSRRWEAVSGWAGLLGLLPAWRGAAMAVGAIVTAGLLAVAVRAPALDLSSYPVAAVEHLAASGRLGPGHRVAAVDVVGCYLVWRAGPSTKVFIDDRYDMYPKAVTDDAAALGAARSDALTVLDRWRVDTVVWSARQALPGELRSSPGWRQDWSDGTWVVLERDLTNT